MSEEYFCAIYRIYSIRQANGHMWRGDTGVAGVRKADYRKCFSDAENAIKNRRLPETCGFSQPVAAGLYQIIAPVEFEFFRGGQHFQFVQHVIQTGIFAPYASRILPETRYLAVDTLKQGIGFAQGSVRRG